MQDIIENEDIKLDNMFIASLVHDLIRVSRNCIFDRILFFLTEPSTRQGMLYIHNSMLICHGNLKSSNCVVTSRWMLQVTDFGLNEMRHCAENDSIGEHQYYRSNCFFASFFVFTPASRTRLPDGRSFELFRAQVCFGKRPSS